MGLFTPAAPTRAGTPFCRRLNGMPDLGQGSGWKEREWRAAPTRSVRLTSLIAINLGGYLSEDIVNRYLRRGGGPVCVVEHRGRLYLADGHHRATAAYRRGETHIRAHVKHIG